MHDLFLAIYLWLSSFFGGGALHLKPAAEEGDTRPSHSSFAPDTVDNRGANPINNGY